MFKKLLEPKIKNFWLNRDEIVNKVWKECKQLACQKLEISSKQHQGSYRKYMSQSPRDSLVSRKGCQT